jgi:hypothetical protein
VKLSLKDLRRAVTYELKRKQILEFNFLFGGEIVDSCDEENYPVEDTVEQN